jgi:hypothetical protein
MIYSIKINEDVDEFLERNNLQDAVTHRFKLWSYLVHIDVEDPYSYDGDYTVSQDTGAELSVEGIQDNAPIGTTQEETDWENSVGYPSIPSPITMVWQMDAVHSRSVEYRSSTYTSTKDGTGVDIYILDTPLVPTHPEIVGRVSDINEGLADSTHADWYTPPGTCIIGGQDYSRVVYNYTDPQGICEANAGVWTEGSFAPDNSGLTIANEVGNRHGLYVAMCAAGSSLGTAPGANIITIPCGTGTGVVITRYVEIALEAIVNHHLRQTPKRNAVINFSIGSRFNPINNVVPHEGGPSANNYAFKHLFMDIQGTYGISVVKSAGNTDTGDFYKGVGHHAPYGTFNGGYITSCWNRSEHDTPSFTIGVSTKKDTIAEWAAYGKSLMVIAPGHQLVVPSANATLVASDWVSNAWWRYISGSSFSSPITAGTIALYLQGKANWFAPSLSEDLLGNVTFNVSDVDTNKVAEWLITNATDGVVDNIGSYEHTIDPFVTYLNANGNSCVVLYTSERTYGYIDFDFSGSSTSAGWYNPGNAIAIDFTLHRQLPPNSPGSGGRYYLVRSIAGESNINSDGSIRQGYNIDLDGTGTTNWWTVCVDRSAFSSGANPILVKDLTYGDDILTTNLITYNPYTVTTTSLFTVKQ